MKRHFLTAALAAGVLLGGVPARAQFGSSLGGLLDGQTGAGANGGVSGMLGGMVPNVGGSSMGNAAGVLSYCVKNRILGGVGATSALSGLLGNTMSRPRRASRLGRAARWWRARARAFRLPA